MTVLDRPQPTLAHPRPTRRLGRWLLLLHRPALSVWTVFVLALSAVLLWARGPLTDACAAAWRQWHACGGAEFCAYNQSAILTYKTVTAYATGAVLAVPFLVAYWSGAVLIGKELENGTAQLAWTQSVSPARWLAAKLALPALVITVGCAVLATLSHLMGTAAHGRVDTAEPWYGWNSFYSGGPVLVALALVGLTAGALSGVLWRRPWPVLAAMVLVYAGMSSVTTHLWPTATKFSSLAHGPASNGWNVRDGLVTASGARIPVPDQVTNCMTDAECRTAYAKIDAVHYFDDYHPASHYWPLQLTSTALMLAIAAALTVAAFRVLKRRTGGAGFLGGVSRASQETQA